MLLPLIPSSSSHIHHSHKSAAAIFQSGAKHDIMPDVYLILLRTLWPPSALLTLSMTFILIAAAVMICSRL